MTGVIPSRRKDLAQRNKMTKYPVRNDTSRASRGRTMPVSIKATAMNMGVLSIINEEVLVPNSASVSSWAEAARRRMRPRARGIFLGRTSSPFRRVALGFSGKDRL